MRGRQRRLLAGGLAGCLDVDAGAGRRAPDPRAHASIVGGQSASIANFPFQVVLYDPQTGSPAAGFFCGGVIIDATHVITAAHCVSGGAHQGAPSAGIEVLAGSTSLDQPAAGSVRDPVQSSAVDSGYDPLDSNDDIALLTLVHPLWSARLRRLSTASTRSHRWHPTRMQRRYMPIPTRARRSQPRPAAGAMSSRRQGTRRATRRACKL